MRQESHITIARALVAFFGLGWAMIVAAKPSRENTLMWNASVSALVPLLVRHRTPDPTDIITA